MFCPKFRYLIACSADSGALNVDGDSALIIASRYNRLSIVEHLLKNSVDMEVQNIGSECALASACAAGHANVVRTLCTANAMVDAHGHEKETPLFSAARYNRVPIIKILTGTFGARVNHQSNDGKTALYVCARLGLELRVCWVSRGSRLLWRDVVLQVRSLREWSLGRCGGPA